MNKQGFIKTIEAIIAVLIIFIFIYYVTPKSSDIKDTSAPILEAIISLQAEAKTVQACDLFKDVRSKVEPPGYKIGLDLTNTQVCAGESVGGVNIISRGRTATGKIQA